MLHTPLRVFAVVPPTVAERPSKPSLDQLQAVFVHFPQLLLWNQLLDHQEAVRAKRGHSLCVNWTILQRLLLFPQPRGGKGVARLGVLLLRAAATQLRAEAAKSAIHGLWHYQAPGLLHPHRPPRARRSSDRASSILDRAVYGSAIAATQVV